MPIVEALGNPNLQKEHWTEIKRIIKMPEEFALEERTFSLGQLIEFNVALYQEEIINVSITATQENKLTNELNDIAKIWGSLEFRVARHKESKDTFKLTEVDIVQTALDESLTNVSNVLGNRYVKRIQARAEEWQQKLNMVADTLEAWKEFQRAWLYLDNIFTSGDIRKNCPKDA